MRDRKLLRLCLLFCCLCGGVYGSAAPARRGALAGQVTLEPPGRLPRLTAHLYYPKEMRRPPLVTSVDEATGRFGFNDLEGDRFLLELYRSGELVHQQAITLSLLGNRPVVIRLRAGGQR